MIVVLDSNIWISLAINQQLDFIKTLQENKMIIASCNNLKEELRLVLSRPKFEKYFPKNYLEKFLSFYQIATTNFDLNEIAYVVSDEKDNYLFALCKISNAAYFITGDKLLLAVENYQQTAVITLADLKLKINLPHHPL